MKAKNINTPGTPDVEFLVNFSHVHFFSSGIKSKSILNYFYLPNASGKHRSEPKHACSLSIGVTKIAIREPALIAK